MSATDLTCIISLTLIPQMTPCALAHDLRQVLESKEICEIHAQLAGEPNG